jgi:hypothetical protein
LIARLINVRSSSVICRQPHEGDFEASSLTKPATSEIAPSTVQLHDQKLAKIEQDRFIMFGWHFTRSAPLAAAAKPNSAWRMNRHAITWWPILRNLHHQFSTRLSNVLNPVS